MHWLVVILWLKSTFQIKLLTWALKDSSIKQYDQEQDQIEQMNEASNAKMRRKQDNKAKGGNQDKCEIQDGNQEEWMMSATEQSKNYQVIENNCMENESRKKAMDYFAIEWSHGGMNNEGDSDDEEMNARRERIW